MARYLTTLQESGETADVGFGGYTQSAAPSRLRRVLLTVAAAALILMAAVAVGTFFYWQSLKGTPQYSLALIIDAARKDDQASMDKLIDTGAVVDDFMPQITAK